MPAHTSNHFLRAVCVAALIVVSILVVTLATGCQPSAPLTKDATNITQTSATLNGTVADLGSLSSADMFFEWGLTTAYGNLAAAGTVSEPGDFSADITGLSPDTTYHFRARGDAQGDSMYGEDKTFTTLPAPPVVATDQASGVAGDSATLNGHLTDLGSASTVEVSFEWGPDTSYGNETAVQTMSQSGDFSATVSGFAGHVTYHFRAKAVGDGVACGEDLTFEDNCPADPNKTEPGACGCGLADTDTDGDGTPDCSDSCPADPNKTDPGACGCGVADTDTDGDGVADCADNCPDTPNPAQGDLDGDGIGDACDRILVYVTPAITDDKILPDSAISSEYISDTISVVAAPGEFEPATFTVRPDIDIEGMEISVSDLTGDSGTIPSSAVDVRVVKCWYQSGIDKPNSGARFLTPELLLKDDSLIDVDMVNEENYLKLDFGQGSEYVWISNPDGISGVEPHPLVDDFPVQDSVNLQPVNIEADTNKQFWLTVTAPDTAAGTYTGTVMLTTPGGLVEELEMDLEVLPFDLSDSPITYSIYYSGRLVGNEEGTTSAYFKNASQYEAELRNMIAHGVTNPNCSQRIDDYLDNALAIRQQAGMSGEPLYYVGSGTHMSENDVARVIASGTGSGFTDVYIYGTDELIAHTDSSDLPSVAAEERAYWEMVHDMGGKAFAAGVRVSEGVYDEVKDPGNFGWFGDVQDMLVCHGFPSREEAGRWHNPDAPEYQEDRDHWPDPDATVERHDIFCYSNPQGGLERAETYRRNFGLLLWQADYDGAMTYAYQTNGAWNSNIWNDFEQYDKRPRAMAYPTVDGVIDTVQWEGWREGVDDARYLATLLDTIEGADSGTAKSAAEAYVEWLRDADLSMMEMDRVRTEIIGHILALQTLPDPSDITAPVISSVEHSAVSLLHSGTASQSAATTITWNTDEPAAGYVEYGVTPAAFDSSPREGLLANHSIELTGLDFDTTYCYAVASVDASGNVSASGTYTFSTSSDLAASFGPPTDADGAEVARDYTEVNVAVDSSLDSTGFIDFDASLLAWWSFDNGSLANQSTHPVGDLQDHGTAYTEDGKFGGARRFSKNGEVYEYLECTAEEVRNLSGDWTIEFWMKPEDGHFSRDGSNWHYLLRGLHGYSSYVAFTWYDGRLQTLLHTADGGYSYTSGGRKGWNDRWYHVGITYDDTARVLKQYIDGRLETATGVQHEIRTGEDNLTISQQTNGFAGAIDEFRIWTRALSPEEILASYDCTANSLTRLFDELTDANHQYYACVSDLTGTASMVQTGTRALTVNAVTPEVTTINATSVATRSATLNGNLHSLGTASTVSVWFESGTNTSYRYRTSPQKMTSAGTFAADLRHLFDLAGLAGGTTYHFRAVADGHGVDYGLDESFTTLTEPPAVATGAATRLTGHSAVLTGTLDSLGSASAIEVSFEWGTASGSLPWTSETQAMDDTGEFSIPLSGLNEETTYYYRAVAVGHGTGYGAESSFTTTASGLVAHWEFDEINGDQTPDSAGSNPGTVHGGAQLTEGAVGLALELDGIDDYVGLRDYPDLQPQDAITIEAWIGADSPSTTDYIFTSKCRTSVARGIYFRLQDTGQLRIGIGNGTDMCHLTSSTTLDAGGWHHVVARWDNGSEEVSLWIDGVKDANVGSLTDSIQYEPTRTISIGRWENSGNFDGALDEVRIHDRALSPEEIEAHYLEGCVTTYVTPAITDDKILPDSAISSEYISDTISVVAVPGEFEPATFTVRPHIDIEGMEISVSDLTGDSGTIPSSAVDVRVVKCWYQSGVGSHNDGARVLTPELLLKDDSLVEVDPINKENYLRVDGEYVWISSPDGIPGVPDEPTIGEFPVQDSSVLRPVSIGMDTNKQFWVTIQVPDGTSAGTYGGKIGLMTPTGLARQLQLDVEVLPLNLSDPCLTYSLYYHGRLRPEGKISAYYKNEDQYRAEQEDLLAHGVGNPAIYQEFDNWPDQVSSATLCQSYLEAALSIRDEVGMGDRPLYYLGLTPWGYQFGTDVQTAMDLIGPYLTGTTTDVYFYGVDEALSQSGTPSLAVNILTDQRPSWTAIRNAGGKIFVAGVRVGNFSDEYRSPGNFGYMGDIQDLLVCHGSPSNEEAAFWHNPGSAPYVLRENWPDPNVSVEPHRIFCYSNPQGGQERAETYRRNFGLLLWQAEYDGAMNYAYQTGPSGSNVWNDFDKEVGGGRPHNFAYPTIDGVIDTIQWEGWREAVDDVRYLTTLENLIETTSTGTASATSYLSNLRNADLSTMDLDRVRTEMIGHILSLQGTPSGSDTTPPVISSVSHSRISMTSSGATMTITWRTDERATGYVRYGKTTEMDECTEASGMLLTRHRVDVNGLDANAVYHFQVVSSDASGNVAAQSTRTFDTSSDMSISFASPTDPDGAEVNRDYTRVNVSLDSNMECTSFIDFARSLVGWWRFDDASDLTDHSTYSNDGTDNDSTHTSEGRFGGGRVFNGITSYIECGNDVSLDVTQAVTLEAWVKLDSLPESGTGVIVGKNWGRYELGVKKDGSFYVRYKYDDSNPAHWCIAKVPSAIGEFHHVVGIVDSSDGLRLHVDGVLLGATDFVGDAIATTPNSLTIGTIAPSGSYNMFDGVIDEVKVWNRALSADEVKASYDAGTNPLARTFGDLPNRTVGAPYEYYACVTDLTGATVQTETRTLAVSASPPLVATSAATSITDTTAILHGVLSDMGTASSVDVWFESGTIACYGGTTRPQTMSSTGSFSYDLTHLIPGTEYHFRAMADGHAVASGLDDGFVTLNDLPVVTTATITQVTGHSVVLHGVLDDLGSCSTVEVSFELGPDSGSPPYASTSATKPMTVTGDFSMPVSGLTDGITYYYRAKAVADGLVAYGSEACFTTASGLISHWTFDEGSGDTAYDSVGSNYGIINGASWTSDAVSGHGLEFDGTTDYVNCGNDASLDITDAITIEAWVKPLGSLAESTGVIAGKYWGRYELGMNRNGTFYVRYKDSDTGTSHKCTDPASSGTGAFYHVVGVIDSSDAAGGLRLYVNGMPVANAGFVGSAIESTIHDVTIGTITDAGGYNMFNGIIDEVRIYDRALSADEILQHYNEENPNS